jgi:ribonuclease BN (tRNA processing enzyme)
LSPALRDIRSLDPAALHVLPLGVGNAFTRTFFNTSVLLVAGGRVVAVDAPAPFRRVLAEAERRSGFRLDLDDIDAVYLTHLHGDHCNGLEELGFWRLFCSDRGRPVLHVEESLAGPLWEHRLRGGMDRVDPSCRASRAEDHGLDLYFKVEPFRAGQPIDLGIPGMELVPLATRHFVPCFGFVARYRGVTLGYSGDTDFDPALLAAMGACDLLLHECGRGPGHSEPSDLLGLPAAMQTGLLAMHVGDDFDDCGGRLPLLQEGALYRVGAGRQPIAPPFSG